MRNEYARVAAVGLDVHYQFSQVRRRDGQGKVVGRERLEHADRAAMRAQLRRWPEGAEYVLEASFGWPFVADELRAAGLKARLCNCCKLEHLRQARGQVKTNKKDADLISQLPLSGEDWWEVWLSPPEVRDRREWTRYRMQLVGLQTRTKNRIHALFHRHGVFFEASDLFGKAGREFLEGRCGEGEHAGGVLPAGALSSPRGLVELWRHLRGQLAKVNSHLRKELVRTAAARILDSVPGIGLVLAHTLVAEIGWPERFGGKHGRLARYSVLGPPSWDTGEADPAEAPPGRHLGHRGKLTLKWAFIEAAHGAVRKSGRFREIFDRYTDGGKHNRNRGYIKVARELVKVVLACWRKMAPYREAYRAGRSGGVAGDGHRQAICQRSHRERLGRKAVMAQFFDSSRSGTGELSHPMVPAR